MQGASVIVIRPVETGRDDHGNATYRYDTQIIDDVLVNKPSTADVTNSQALTKSISLSWVLSFPKTYQESLRGCYVVLPAIINQKYKVIGDPQPIPPANCPTRWNYTVMIGVQGA